MFKSAKIDTTIAFLKSKGWKLKKSKKTFFLLNPPKEIKSNEGFNFRIPKSDKGSDFKEYMTHLVFSIADLYELNKWDLLDLLSKSLPQIQKDVEYQQFEIKLKQQLLASAS